MFDVNVEAVIASLSGSPGIENIQPFLVGEKKVININLRADHKGYLELQTVSGGPVFLFKDVISESEAEQRMKEVNPNFHLAAAVGQASFMQMESSMGQIVLFSEKASVGFIRTCQYPDPPYTTQAKLG